MEAINNILAEWMQNAGMNAIWTNICLRLVAVLIIVIFSYTLNRIFKKILIPATRRFTAKTAVVWDDHLFNYDVLRHLARLITPIIVDIMLPYIFPNEPKLLSFTHKACDIYIIYVVIKLICAFITSFYNLSNSTSKNHSVKGFYQMIKLVMICIGVIISISILIDKNPIVILTGLGAGTAILMLIFQDTIKGLVAGVQLMANDMLRPGDWITMSKHGVDGDVLEVSLTTVKVQNWDKTIVTVPPYVLVNESFQNWRGMYDIGGRRIKRSINIDMNTIRFCTKDEMEQYSHEVWMKDYKASHKDDVNLHIFRHYVEYYLTHHPEVNTNLIMTVRQLQPTAEGLPIELYFFSSDTRWLNYEHLQAEVFDHVLSMLETFDLKVFQSPAGTDIKDISQTNKSLK